jgi:alcohol dehydrogenase (cytochrome c)/quinohemoprotein ethanol dehydrogenase
MNTMSRAFWAVWNQMMRNASAAIAVNVLGASLAFPQTDFATRIQNADAEPENWLSHGRNYQETRDSPLAQINVGNVTQLGLAWSYDLDTNRGQEATPIVVDGVMYTTSAWSKVQAFEATTGRLLWQFDPKVPGESAVKSCCDVVNRGVAFWDGKVYVGTIDGRLIAINGKSGAIVWSVLTIDPQSQSAITGAPRIVKGKVIIGNAGADQGARGYVSAYDAATGRLVWRFYTVPGEPGKVDGAASDEILRSIALPTWDGHWWTKGGGLGGGTVWDAISYDPQLDLLYVGVGNGSYWNRKYRSNSRGDNLFVSSIIALRPDTGAYVWHYQEVPGDEWDYDATQQMVLADLELGGSVRKVLMQASKNGFFYLLDRVSGKLIAATPFVPQTWTDGIDPTTGRPAVRASARYSVTNKPFVLLPSGGGAHNWQSMAYSARTGLVYVPVQDYGNMMAPDLNFKPKPVGTNNGIDMSSAFPTDPALLAQLSPTKGHLLAWNPRTQREAWRVTYDGIPNGGILSTGGDLVFQGDSHGFLNAYDATTGGKLWSNDLGSVASGAPITWSHAGRQYVSIVAGWGGAMGLLMGNLANDKNGNRPPLTGRVLTFTLGGAANLPPRERTHRAPPTPVAQFGDAATIERGRINYDRVCVVCHGFNAESASAIPDLRYSGTLTTREAWMAIVEGGALASKGMVSFSRDFSSTDIDAIRAYIIDQTRPPPSTAHGVKN